MLITPNPKTNVIDFMSKIEFTLHLENQDVVKVLAL